MKSLQAYICEAKNGVISDLKVGETIYILCLSKSNKPVSANIIKIDTSSKGRNFYIELDKEVFGSKFINYWLLKDGAKGMRDSEINGADPDLFPIYNGRLDGEKDNLEIVFGRSKEEIKEMVDSSYANKLKEMQEKADDLYREYLEQIDEIRNFTEKIYIDMSDDDPDNLG